MSTISDVKEAVSSFANLAAKPLFAVSVGTGMAIFLPSSLLQLLGIDAVIGQYRHWVGTAFLVSTSYLAAHFLWWCAHAIRTFRNRRAAVAAKMKYLRTLTPEEKGYLLPFIHNQINSKKFDFEDGIAAGLRAKKILFLPTSVGDVLEGIAHNLQPWAREALEQDNSLLDGAIEPRRRRRI